ncbi:hypothetical protein [Demequina aestuarii]|uniref:hypothetical protein n=1 Tax=Demequina aestuarii TaxID=327095 RepID=UPI000784B2C3|nr:hypothetical protein [Demequina aestuarii]
MGTINRQWHADHRMPAKATEDQRGAWHSEHIEACGCRELSAREQDLVVRWRDAQRAAKD